jgi:hypothetical protein
MNVLTLTTSAVPSLKHRPLLQILTALPPPNLPGLRARYWRVDRQRLQGRYLFDERRGVDALIHNLRIDDAVVMLQEQPLAQRVAVSSVEHVAADDARHAFNRPVFIVSAPRAASTLLYETLAQASGFWTVDGEGNSFIEGIPPLHLANRGYDSHRLTEDDADRLTVEALQVGYLADLRDRRGRRWLELPVSGRPARPRLLDKTPENALRIPFLRAAFPDARFVLLHREARPNVSSILEAWHHQGFTNVPDLPDWERRRWCFLLPPGWRSLNHAPLSDVAALQWRVANEQALDDLDAVPRELWTSVGYQDLVTAFPAVIRRLCAFLEVEVDGGLVDVLSRPPRLSSTTTTAPSPIKWRSNRELRDSSFAHLGLVGGRLRNLTTSNEALRAAARPQQPPVLDYACFLDDLPPRAAAPTVDRIVNPSLQVQVGVTVPLSIMRRTRFRERLLAGHPLLWVEDPATRVVHPFWARRGDIRLLRELQPGWEPPSTLPPGLVERLERAGAVVRRAEPEGQAARGQQQVTRAAAELVQQRHTRLTSVIHPGHVAALADYYRRLINTGQWELGDAQVERRHGWHNERMARFFQHQLTWLVGRVAGEQVKPTYTFSSAYRGGAALKAHVDREQCDYTMSVVIDQSAGFESDPWPLWFAAPDGRQSVTLQLGDAALFRGCELPHWREAAPPDRQQTVLLFHYVPVGFTGVLD